MYQRIKEVPFPLAEVVYGVLRVIQHNRRGHDSYLLGENRTYGWWYFFPVALGVKTPLPFLIFAGIGAKLVLDGEPVIGTGTFSAVVIMVIVTTLVTPPALKISLLRGDKKKEAAEE